MPTLVFPARHEGTFRLIAARMQQLISEPTFKALRKLRQETDSLQPKSMYTRVNGLQKRARNMRITCKWRSLVEYVWALGAYIHLIACLKTHHIVHVVLRPSHITVCSGDGHAMHTSWPHHTFYIVQCTCFGTRWSCTSDVVLTACIFSHTLFSVQSFLHETLKAG